MGFVLALLLSTGSIAFERGNVVAVLDPATAVTRDLVVGGQPVWSPDGSRLAFVRDETVYVASADGSGARAVGNGMWPSWSPDGTHLAIIDWDGQPTALSPRGTRQLYTVDIATGTRNQLTGGTANVLLPAWSPDGTRIAYMTSFPGGEGMWTIPAPGGTPTIVCLGAALPNSGPAWSPDGTQLAFVSTLGNVWRVPAGGGEAQPVSYVIAGTTRFYDHPAWSPDGSQIAWNAGGSLCTTTLAGDAHRLAPQGGYPAWQRGDVVPSSGPSCDRNVDVRIDLYDDGPSPRDVTLTAPQSIYFVNHTDHPVTVQTTERSESATLYLPGNYLGFSTEPGKYTYVADGRSGSFTVLAPVRITLHRSRDVLLGVVSGAWHGVEFELVRRAPGGKPFHAAWVVPDARGRWRVAVQPRQTTQYSLRGGYGASSWATVPAHRR